jgi:inosine/xanthosine triphosphatase
MKIIVASSNPVKINAVKAAYAAMFPDAIFTVEGSSMDGFISTLPSQPIGDEVTCQCAIERVQSLKQRHPNADMWVGIEGGVEYRDSPKTQMDCFAWIVFENAKGHIGDARTATFSLPKAVSDLVDQGIELGHANDRVFNMQNSKQGIGMTGTITHGVMDRTEYYVHAAILALVPFKNETLYFLQQTSEAA